MSFALLRPIPLDAQERTAPTGWTPDNPFTAPEAPETLFSLTQGDDDVDIYAFGGWTGSGALGWAVALHPPDGAGRRVTAGYPVAGVASRPATQSADVTLSVWLQQRLFFEASVAGDRSLDSIAAGYYGDGTGALSELVFGAVPLAAAPWLFQAGGSPTGQAGRDPAPGARVELAGATARAQGVVQLLASRDAAVRLVGTRIVDEVRVSAGDYARRRLFVLPDAAPEQFELLVEGAGGVFEPTNDYVIDRETGVVRLTAPIGARRLAVWYEIDGAPVGSAGLGDGALPGWDAVVGAPSATAPVDFSFDGAWEGGDPATWRVTISGGRTALLLAAPGFRSPFEAANLYALPPSVSAAPEEVETASLVVRAGSRLPAEALRIGSVAGAPFVLLVAEPFVDPRDPRWRFPLLARDGRSAAIYGAAPRPDAADVELLFERYDDSGATISDDIVPGSVRARVNGVVGDAVTVDPATGALVTDDAVPGDAQIDISYRVPGGDRTDAQFVVGGEWQPVAAHRLEASVGGRWPLRVAPFAERDGENPGSITASAGYTFRGDALAVAAGGAFQVGTPEASGVLRLYGATPLTRAVAPRPDGALPGPLPERLVAGTTSAGRRDLRFRTYVTTDLLGSVAYARWQEERPVEEGTARTPTGPYLAAALDPDYTGAVMVAEWPALAAGEWVAAHLRTADGAIDARGAWELSLPLRLAAAPGEADLPATVEIAIDVGALGEDIDGDGVSAVGRSAADPAIPIVRADGTPGLAGTPIPTTGAAYREESGDDAFLAPERDDAIVRIPVGGDELADGEWTTVRYAIDAADAARLGAVRGVRLIVAAPTGSPAGRLIVGAAQLRLAGSGATTAAADGGAPGGAVRAVVQDDPGLASDAQPTTPLSEVDPIVGERFHTADDASDAKALAVTFSDAATRGLSAELAVTPFFPGRWETVRLFLALDAASLPVDPGATVALTLATARDGDSFTATIPAAAVTGAWHRVEIDSATGAVAVDGVAVDAAQIDGAGASTPAALGVAGNAVTRVTVAVSGVDAGTLWIDELHLTGPAAGTAAAAFTDVTWRMGGERAAIAVAHRTDLLVGAFQDAGGLPLTSLARAEYALRQTGRVTTTLGPVELAAGAGAGDDGAPVADAALRLAAGRGPLAELGVSRRGGALPRQTQRGVVTWGVVTATHRAERDVTGSVQEWTTGLTLARLSVDLSATHRSLPGAILPPDASSLAALVGDPVAILDGAAVDLLPRREGVARRTTSLAIRLDDGTAERPVGFSGLLSAAIDVAPETSGTSRMAAEMTLPVRGVAGRPWSLTPRVGWSWSVATATGGPAGSAEAGVGRGGDVGRFLEALGRDARGVVDAPAPLPDGIVLREVDRSAALTWASPAGSRPIDLLVPGRATVTAARSTTVDGPVPVDERSLSLALASQAIDLLRRRAPDRIAADEIVLSGGIDQSLAVDATAEIAVDLATDDALSVVATASQASLAIGAGWTRPGRRPLTLPDRPTLRRIAGNELPITNRSGIDVSLSPATRATEATVEHRVDAAIGDAGSASGTARLVVGRDPASYDDGALWYVGAVIELSASLRF